METKKVFLEAISIFLIAAAILMNTACSATISGKSDDQPPQKLTNPNDGFFDQRPTIEGPKLDGHWTSLCTQYFPNSYRIFDITVSENKITRIEKNYSDQNCTIQFKSYEEKGRFRFIEKYKDEVFRAEYAFENGTRLGNPAGNVTIFQQELIRLVSNELFISGYNTSEDALLLTKEPLLLQSRESSNDSTALEE